MWVALTKSKALDRDELCRRAELEIKAELAGVEVFPSSGIPWSQYERAWREMACPVRESFAMSQIVPILRKTSNDAVSGDRHHYELEPLERLDQVDLVDDNERARARARLAGHELELERALKMPGLSKSDRALLLAAREKVRAARAIDCG
jgi:hypothetical protein